MYCKLDIQIESTIDEYDMAEVQRQKIESSEEDTMDINTSSLGENSVIFDFEDLEPVIERIKLEGDEYEKSRKRRNKDELTATATMEIYRSLDSLPVEHKLQMKEAIED